MAVFEMQNWPKAELHVHLDTSLSYPLVAMLSPGITREAYLKYYTAPRRCLNLKEFLSYVSPCLDLLQTETALRLALRDLIGQQCRDGVIYSEIRLCPLLHTRGKLSADDVAQILCSELEELTNPAMQVSLIFSSLRHFSSEESKQVVRVAERFLGQGVVGFDLAGDEASFSLDNHMAAFRWAKDAGLKTTVHAGEAQGPESVWSALKTLQPDRIGHGVRAVEDPVLIRTLRESVTHLEVCVTSNLQTGIYSHVTDHPLNELLRSGISLSLNTDGRGLTQTSLSEEFATVQRAFNWTADMFYEVQRQALHAAFCDDLQRESLLKKLEDAYLPLLIETNE
jgi:adenosine deaminase